MSRRLTIAALMMGTFIVAPQTLAAQTVTSDSTPIAAAPKSGFFVGLHSGLISDSGLVPVVAGNSITVDDSARRSLTANGYYMYTTDWSFGTYVGGGLGAFNLPSDYVAGLSSGSLDLGYQGMAGVTYQFSPSMTLGLEYRYLGSVDPWSQRSFDVTPAKDESQSVSLRFDFSF